MTPPRSGHHAATAWVGRAAFSVLFLAAMFLAAVLSERHTVSFDWSDSGRNTLSEASIALLQRMPETIRIRAFVTGNDTLREAVRQLIGRYRRAHPDIELEFIDPQREPRIAEQFGIRRDGELVIEYAGARETVQELAERRLSNALARLSRQSTDWIVWLESPGARALDGSDRPDLGAFAQHLAGSGIKLHPMSVDATSGIPDNVGLVVVPPPREPWPDTAASAVRDYIERGGNLLWLADPAGIAPPVLTETLAVTPEPGLLVDPSSRLDGRPTPEFIVIEGFASHPVSDGLAPFIAFPTATSLGWEARDGWRVRGLAASGLRSWRESGDLQQAVRFDEGVDTPGPLDIAVALERPHPSGSGSQRIVVVGDIDFLSNAYLGLGANRDLGSNIVNWLGDAEELVNVPAMQAPDLDYAPDQAARAVIALGAPIALPLVLFAYGVLRWRRRRNR